MGTVRGMGRIITVVLTLGAISFLAYRVIYNQKGDANGPSAPKQQLDNVRQSAKRIETTDQQYVDDVAKKTESP